MEDNLKQVIVMRTDLCMTKGKMIAQGAHASMKVFFDRMVEEQSGFVSTDAAVEMQLMITKQMWEWATNKFFTKICVRVENEEDLLDIYERAQSENIVSAIVLDSGRTMFKGVPTHTCCAIGPDLSSIIDPVTKDLRLL